MPEGVTEILSRPEIVKFRTFLKERVDGNEPPLQVIPDEYTGLIAQLVHERYNFL